MEEVQAQREVLERLFKIMKTWSMERLRDWIAEIIGNDEAMKPAIQELYERQDISAKEIIGVFQRTFIEEESQEGEKEFDSETNKKPGSEASVDEEVKGGASLVLDASSSSSASKDETDGEGRKRKFVLSESPSDQEASKKQKVPAGKDAATEALSDEKVLKKLFRLLNTRTLLELSLVNKTWSCAARSILRNHRKCLAGIMGRNPCQELRELNQTLAKSDYHPYSGLVIRTFDASAKRASDIKGNMESSWLCDDVETDDFNYHSFESEDSLSSSELDIDRKVRGNHQCIKAKVALTYSAILEKIVFRHVGIAWDTNLVCPAQRLMRKILKEKRHEIVDISITRLPDSIFSLKEYLHIKERDWLPNLRALDVLRYHSKLPSHFSKIGWKHPLKYDLIQASPFLRERSGLNVY